MKKSLIFLFPVALLIATISASRPVQEVLTVKGFFLEMTREAAQEVYDGFVADQVADRISMEKEAYRDLITLDNEFSSMGNKVELAYDENETVTGITFHYKTVEVLFDAGGEDAEAFVKRFCDDYGLPEMQFDDQGVIQIWKYEDEASGFKVSVDNAKNLRIQAL